MNAEPLVVHRNDNLPDLYLKVFDQDNEVWVDLSLATTVVTAKFRQRGTTTVLQTITCTKVSGGDDGIVLLTWPTDALDDLDPGLYEIEVSVDFDGKEQTANRYGWCDDTSRSGRVLLVRVLEDF